MNISQLRNGMMIIFDGKFYQVIAFSKCIGGMKVDVVNIQTQKKSQITIKESDSFENFYPERKKLDFSMKDDSTYTFLDPDTYDIITVDKNHVDSGMELVNAADRCEAFIYNGTILTIKPPTTVKATVESVITEGGQKYAIVKGNIKVSVPNYINVGSCIVIHTITHQFMTFC